MTLLAYIPSPHTGTIDVGPLKIHMYGLMLLLAIAGCVALTGYRWVRWGGDWDLVFRVAVWGVAAGIVGARLYHDITSWSEVPDKWWGPFAAGEWWRGPNGRVTSLFAHTVPNPAPPPPTFGWSPSPSRGGFEGGYSTKSNRSAFITLVQAATKSATNFSFASAAA